MRIARTSMSINQSTRSHGTPPPHELPVEYVVVRTTHCRFSVTRLEAARIVALLERWWVPRWIEFTDVQGTLVRVRAGAIVELFDSSPAMRMAEWTMNHMLDREQQRVMRYLDNTMNTEEDG